MKIKIRFCNGHELELSEVLTYDFRGEYLQVVFNDNPMALKAPYRNIDYVSPINALPISAKNYAAPESSKTLGLKGKDNA